MWKLEAIAHALFYFDYPPPTFFPSNDSNVVDLRERKGSNNMAHLASQFEFLLHFHLLFLYACA